MEPTQKIERQYTLVGLVVFTFVGIVIQVLFLTEQLIAAPNQLNSPSPVISLIPTDVLSAVAYLLWPVLYCSVVSLIPKPKRIVSPLYIQIGTVSLSLLIIANYAINSQMITTPVFTENLLAFLFVWMLVLGFAGFFQLVVVRWVVGLNSEDLDNRMTYLINGELEIVRKAFNKDFLDVYPFKRVRGVKNIIMRKLHEPTGDTVILALGENPNNPKESLLATVPFKQSLYSISNSKKARNIRDAAVGFLEKQIPPRKPPIKFKPRETDDVISEKAYAHALSPSQPKIEAGVSFLQEIPRYYAYLILFTLIALVVATVAYFTKFADFGFSSYLSTVLILIVVLFGEIRLALRGELKEESGTSD